jgi:hypothetical protein
MLGVVMVGPRRQELRSAVAFFLITFSTAFLMTIGVRLTGWFTRLPQVTPESAQTLGICMMGAVLVLAVGAGLRRLNVVELRSALLGAASILLAIPVSYAVISHTWQISTTIIGGLGLLLLGIGLLVAWGNPPSASETPD